MFGDNGEARTFPERRGQPKTMSYYTQWIVVLTFLIQLGLGAVAYGRLDGRVSSIENDVKLLLQTAMEKK